MKRSGVLAIVLSVLSIGHATEIVTTLPEVIISGVVTGASRNFSKHEIAKTGARTAAEFLEHIPGLAMRRDGASGGKQFARIGGSNVNQVMVLLDGVRISDVGSGETDLSGIPVEWIESIEVNTGGSSVLGGEAIGGVISIRTSNVSLNNFTTTARGSETTTEYGAKQDWSKGETQASIGVTHEQGQGNYRFRITEEDGNGPFTARLGEIFRRENNEMTRDRLICKVKHDFGGHEVSASAWVDRSEFGLPGYLAPRPTPLASQEEHFRLTQFSWNSNSKVGHLSATAGFQDRTRDFSDPDPYSYLYQSHESSNRSSATASVQRKLRNVGIVWNAHVEREQIESGILQYTRALRNRWQTSLQFDQMKKFGSSARQALYFQLGVNAERFGDSNIQGLPSGEVSYTNNVSLPFEIGIRGSKAYMAPSFYSLFWNSELLAQGNPKLRPEASEMWQSFGKLKTRHRLVTSLRVFASHNDVKDLIYWRNAFDGRWTPQNLRKATLDQLTVGIDQVLLPSHLEAGLSMEWLEARDRSGEHLTDRKYLIYRPLRTFDATLRAKSNEFQGFVQVNWVDKQAVLETNSKWLADYTLVNVEISRKFSLGATQWDVGMHCDNLLDQDYRIVRFAPMPLRDITGFITLKWGIDSK